MGKAKTHKIKFGDNNKESVDDELYLDSDEVNRLDVGLQLGGGVELRAGPGLCCWTYARA